MIYVKENIFPVTNYKSLSQYKKKLLSSIFKRDRTIRYHFLTGSIIHTFLYLMVLDSDAICYHGRADFLAISVFFYI